MNRIDRVSAILIQLQSKKIVKAQDIADRFDISLRTVYRDISTLYEAGVPIISEGGVGYKLSEGYRLPPVSFTLDEATTFLTAEKLVEKFTDKKTYLSYQSALFKIKAILRHTEKEYLDNLDDHIQVIEHPYLPKREKNNADIDAILKSIATKTVLTIDYFAEHNQEKTTRNIEAVGIYFSSGNWHLMAYCLLRNDYRNFRIDRVSRVFFTEQPFHKKHEPLKSYLKEIKAKDKDAVSEIIVMRIDKNMRRYLGDQKYYLGYVSEKVIKHQIEMTFLTSSIEGFARWFMMFGDNAEIVQPQSVKDKIKKMSENILKNMEDSTNT
jgi:predicted DNA-binding transcriptional regulator YafY